MQEPKTEPTTEGQVRREAIAVRGRVVEIGYYGNTTDRALYVLTVNGVKLGGRLRLRKDSEIQESALYDNQEAYIDREVVASIIHVGSDYTVVTVRRVT
jgi:hypothetical protein